MNHQPLEKIVAALRLRGLEPHFIGGDYGTWVARCPIHQGHQHTLGVTRSRDHGVSLGCRCAHSSGRAVTPEDILRDLGLSLSDLSPPPAATATRPAFNPDLGELSRVEPTATESGARDGA